MAKPKREIVPAAEVVLLGGGHSHVEVVKRFAKLSPKPYRLTLINTSADVAYAGMLPGLIAGLYRYDEAHIDLGHLCKEAGVRFINDTIAALDPAKRIVQIGKMGRSISYDAVSVDVGLFAELPPSPQLLKRVVAMKPIRQFLQVLEELEAELENYSAASPHEITVYGGCSAAMELCLALAHRFNSKAGSIGKAKLTYISPFHDVLPDRFKKFTKPLKVRLAKSGVKVVTGYEIKDCQGDDLILTNKERVPCHKLIWMHVVSGAPWLAASSIDTNEKGLIKVNSNLESCSHDGVYAAGDTAMCNQEQSISMNGLLAYKMGTVLAENFRRRFLGQPQLNYEFRKPYKFFISADGHRAVGSWYGFSFSQSRMWQLKDELDRWWTSRYQVPAKETRVATFMESGNLTEEPCPGVATRLPSGKAVGSTVAKATASVLKNPTSLHLYTDPASNRDIMRTNDFLRGFVSDPYRFGMLSANHCLNHFYGEGGQALYAHVFIATEFGPKQAMTRDLQVILDGAMTVFEDHGVSANTGYYWGAWESGCGATLEGQKLLAEQKQKLMVGDKFILTGKLGTGILLAGYGRYIVSSSHLDQALATMEVSHKPMLDIYRDGKVKTSFAVGAFGLAWNFASLMVGTNLAVNVRLDHLPIHAGALKALSTGVRSSLHVQNRLKFSRSLHGLSHREIVLSELTFDPQTVGGIVICVAEEDAENTLAKVREFSPDASIVATIAAAEQDIPEIRFCS